MSVAAIVVAAGQGSRFGGAKQFFDLNGVSVAARSVATARSVASFVVLVVPADYNGDGEGADIVVTGGETRASSVRAGLTHCAAAAIVLVHDAARPFATKELFQSVVSVIEGGASAVIPGLEMSDTVKRVEHRADVTVVAATLSRDELVTVQTPQAFRYDVLLRAHEHNDEATDDAALVEALGIEVVVVSGEASNRKITYREDVEQHVDRESRS